MPNAPKTDSSAETAAAARPGSSQVPGLSLPRGGGAIRGTGQRSAAGPVTGTGAMIVPSATNPDRLGFSPQLSLAYDSGCGSGPFGFGRSRSLHAITRRTDEGLPQYLDAEDSNVFILSGAEDLLPEFTQDADGHWAPKGGRHAIRDNPRTVNGARYNARRCRPRIEGLFARIERWTNADDPGDTHWRSIWKDNVLTPPGKDAGSRISDPERPGRFFNWLTCEARDDKGSAGHCAYQAQDEEGADLIRAHGCNRGDARRTVNRCLKHLYYGSRAPLLAGDGQRPTMLTAAQLNAADWMLEVVFDHGDHDLSAPLPSNGEGRGRTTRAAMALPPRSICTYRLRHDCRHRAPHPPHGAGRQRTAARQGDAGPPGYDCEGSRGRVGAAVLGPARVLQRPGTVPGGTRATDRAHLRVLDAAPPARARSALGSASTGRASAGSLPRSGSSGRRRGRRQGAGRRDQGPCGTELQPGARPTSGQPPRRHASSRSISAPPAGLICGWP